MHAVIIGINAYACNAIGKRENSVPSELSPQIAVAPDLAGAVADADAVHDLLVQVLEVPLANITNLRNHQATRENIIQALEGFAANDDIKRNDPILIYYAGHGATSKAPQEWSNANEIIQLLVPHDFSGRLLREPGVRSISNTTDVYGIPDRTFGALLNKISAAKGNNIVRHFLLHPLLSSNVYHRRSYLIAVTLGLRHATYKPPTYLPMHEAVA